MASPDEAKATPQKARSAVTEVGRDAAFAALAAEDGVFRDKNRYVFLHGRERLAARSLANARAEAAPPEVNGQARLSGML
ncbi:MAG: hypothetical protein PVJ30_09820 [Thiohalocapsa sp.]|jgi:hypothetical protein